MLITAAVVLSAGLERVLLQSAQPQLGAKVQRGVPLALRLHHHHLPLAHALSRYSSSAHGVLGLCVVQLEQ